MVFFVSSTDLSTQQCVASAQINKNASSCKSGSRSGFCDAPGSLFLSRSFGCFSNLRRILFFSLVFCFFCCSYAADRTKSRDFYTILGVPREADVPLIKKVSR